VARTARTGDITGNACSGLCLADSLERLTAALADRYRVERELGEGGMATVYLAHDLKHERDVAIKVLRPEIGAALGADRFLLEIKTTANLRHPHIVPLYDSGEILLAPAAPGEGPQALLYYVMPLVEGESLRHRLAREKQLPIDEALRIAGEVADALSYAHARGVVHRDIKPENILLEGGHAVVADFGIARAMRAAGAERLTGTGTSVGTPAYVSPEQAAGEGDIDGRSDLYSLACVLYEMLGGQAPFTGPTAAAITRQHLIADPPPITNLRPSVPAPVVDALQRALSKSPADRFNPVAQFGAAIAPGAVATGTTAAPARARRAGAPRRIAIGLLAVAIVTAIVIWRLVSAPPAGATTSIAVLPFADLSPDHSNAYLGDGIAETLIDALVNVSGLTVAARTSAFSFRGREADVREIGRELHVAAVLEGSVQRAGDQLRVTAQLVRTADGVNLWSQRFDRPATEIFAVQDEVARSAVAAMQLTMSPSADSVGAVGGTKVSAAYDAYLLGRYHWNLRTTEGMIHATTAFRQAVALDSGYARGWSGLADAYALSIPTEYNVPGLSQDSLLTLGEQAARRAIALAPTLGEAYASLGEILEGRSRWSEATAQFEQAVRLAPRYPTGHQWYAYNLQVHVRWDEAVREMEIAHQLDPLSHVITLSLASLYDGADRFAEATPLYAQGLAQSPEAWYAWMGRVGHELALGHVDSAAASFRRVLRSEGVDSATAAATERGLVDPATRDATVDALIRGDDLQGHHAAVAFARWTRDEAAVYRVLERMAGQGTGSTPIIIAYALLGPKLRADPRVQALMAKVGAPPPGAPRQAP